MYLISTYLAKIIRFTINLLRLGSGNTWPGHVVLYLNKFIWKDLQKRIPSKVIYITGTNGKTTTAKLTSHILKANNLRVLTNTSGANILNGVLTCLLLGTDLKGSLSRYDALVIEVDEFTLPVLMDKIKPTHVALLNLSRDQLDRHWETDIILDKWITAVKNSDTHLIIDRTQVVFEQLGSSYPTVSFFNDDPAAIELSTMRGSFNAKNINCALVIAQKLGLDREVSLSSLRDFSYAYGRGELLNYKGTNFKILLAKNPASVNQNLKLINSLEDPYDTLLFVLNDRVPDGHDVSWIYDIDPYLLQTAGMSRKIYVAGTRAQDMAIRLVYSGLKIDSMNIGDLSSIINAVVANPASANVLLLPNYSAMLESRKILAGRRIL